MRTKSLFVLVLIIVAIYRIFWHGESAAAVALICVLAFFILSPLLYDRD